MHRRSQFDSGLSGPAELRKCKSQLRQTAKRDSVVLNASKWTRCPADDRQICPPLFEGTEERLQRCRRDCRSRAAPDDEFVATKTAEQLDLQALHRVGERLV